MTASRTYDDAEATRLVLEYQQSRDERLRARIVEMLKPLVLSAARRYSGREPIEDLEGEGYLGLLTALERFIPGRGARFSTFATHLIAGQIRHYLRDRGHLIRQPAWVQELDSRVEQTSRALRQQLMREPTLDELAAATNLRAESIEELLAARRVAQVTRLDGAGAGAEDEDHLFVNSEKIRSLRPETLRLPVEDRIAVERALHRLKRLEREVIYNFFYRDLTQSETARQLGISPNYTGYLLRRGLGKLKEILFGDPVVEGGEPISDTLSGFYSFSYFRKRLDEEICRCSSREGRFALVEMRLPPAATDRAVSHAAGLLRAYTRLVDLRCRRSTQTFLLLFPDTGPAAHRVTANLVELVERDLELKVATTVALFPTQARSGDTLLELVSRPAPASSPSRSRGRKAKGAPALAVDAVPREKQVSGA